MVRMTQQRMNDYRIGDKVWTVERNHTGRWVQCPECFGTKFVTVILGDDSKLTVDCTTCGCGFNNPTGVVETYDIEWTLMTETKV